MKVAELEEQLRDVSTDRNYFYPLNRSGFRHAKSAYAVSLTAPPKGGARGSHDRTNTQ